MSSKDIERLLHPDNMEGLPGTITLHPGGEAEFQSSSGDALMFVRLPPRVSEKGLGLLVCHWSTARSLPKAPETMVGPLVDGQLELSPSSASVDASVPYRFELGTHCGLDSSPDFDGSLWDLTDPPDYVGRSTPPLGLFGNPSEVGTMTLVSRDVAVYRSSLGRTLTFRRHTGSKVVDECI